MTTETLHRVASRRRGARVVAALLSGRGVLVFWILYGLVHALFRYSYSGTLALDDARASELVQSFALGYQARQPPLYEWLLWSSQQLLGIGIASHLLVRYLLIAALGCAIYAATRHALRDQRLAALASFSLGVGYHIGWTFHESGTQSVLLSVACVCTFDATMRFLARPSLPRTAWLGFALAIGFLSKHSYALFLLGFVLAIASLPEPRRHLRDQRLIVSVLVALVLMSPYLVWLVQVHGSVVAASETALIHGQLGHAARAGLGLARLAWSLPGFLLPWIAFMAILAPAAFARAPASAAPASLAEQLAGRTMVIAALLAAIGIVAVGATNIHERYMHPILILAPVYVFARIDRLAATEKRIFRLAVFVLAGAVAVFCIRVLSLVDNGITETDPFHTFVPYEQFAKELTARGLDQGTLLTPDIRIAGNLHAFLPRLRVITPESYRLVRPPRRPADEKTCFLVWNDGEDWSVNTIVPLKGLKRERIVIDVPHSIFGGFRRGVWWIARLDPQSRPCS
jgi:Dolichyl-phosphate-mannose-protein mannosyltransferase